MRRALLLLCLLVPVAQHPEVAPGTIQFVVTSDLHYGIRRAAFRGKANVDSHIVNAAMVSAMNRLQYVSFPQDGGLRSGQTIGSVSFVAITGDIANREEVPSDGSAPIQSAAASWRQFAADFENGLDLRQSDGKR